MKYIFLFTLFVSAVCLGQQKQSPDNNIISKNPGITLPEDQQNLIDSLKNFLKNKKSVLGFNPKSQKQYDNMPFHAPPKNLTFNMPESLPDSRISYNMPVAKPLEGKLIKPDGIILRDGKLKIPFPVPQDSLKN